MYAAETAPTILHKALIVILQILSETLVKIVANTETKNVIKI